MLLDLVGVPTPIIVEDYALTARYFSEPASSVDASDWRHEPLELESPPEFMAQALEHLDRAHGGARALLRTAGDSGRRHRRVGRTADRSGRLRA